MMEFANFADWQSFERFVKQILEKFDFEIEFRKVFRAEGSSKYEIDLVAHNQKIVLCFDCKFYGKARHRVSSLRAEAKKHAKRSAEFERIIKKRCIPVIITWLDDPLLIESGCIFVPINKLNDFLNNAHAYLEEFGIL